MAGKEKAVPLSELLHNQEAIVFALLAGIKPGKTKDGKPYFRAAFRDKNREVQAMIWLNTPLYEQCANTWKVGGFYKMRVLYKESDFGPSIEIRRIREAVEADKENGFSPNLCRPVIAQDPAVLMDEILSLAKERIGKGPLLLLIQRIFKEKRDRLLDAPSSRHHHHNRFGGLMEHTLSAARIAAALCDQFLSAYPPKKGEKVPFSVPLVMAGIILHEIGKIDAMAEGALLPAHSAAGDLIGYPVLSRDLVRQYAPAAGLEPAVQLHLEHILLAHPRFPDWGAVGSPASQEAAIVHLADYADSLYGTMRNILAADQSNGLFTFAKGPFDGPILKRLEPLPREKNDI